MADLQHKREAWKREQARLRATLKKYDDFSFNIPSITNYKENINVLKYVGGVGILYILTPLRSAGREACMW